MKDKFDNAIWYSFLIFSLAMMIFNMIVSTYEPFENNELVLKYLKYPFPLAFFMFLLFFRIKGMKEMGNKFDSAIYFLLLIFIFVMTIIHMIIDTSQPFDDNELVLDYLRYSSFLGILVFIGLSYTGKILKRLKK
jgi:hypothetical protein